MKKEWVVLSASCLVCVLCSCCVASVGIFISIASVGFTTDNIYTQTSSVSKESEIKNVIDLDKLSTLPEDISDKTKKELLDEFNVYFKIRYVSSNETVYADYFAEDLEYMQLNLAYFHRNLDSIFNTSKTDRITIFFYDDLETFEQDAGITIKQGKSQGFAVVPDSLEVLVYEPVSDYFWSYGTVSLLSHELVHIYLATIVPNDSYLPRWFKEGQAEWISVFEYDIYEKMEVTPPTSLSDLGDALHETIGDSEEMFKLYIVSYSFYGYLEGKFGRDTLLKIAKDTSIDKSFESSFRNHTQSDIEQEYFLFLDDWKISVQ